MFLTLDTASAHCSARLTSGAGSLEATRNMARGHDVALPVLVKDLFDDTEANPLELTRVIILTGPGSFAGVRIGLSFGRALAMAARCPSIGVTAMQALLHTESEGTLVIIDVKRGQYLVQAKGEEDFATMSRAELIAAISPPPRKLSGNRVDALDFLSDCSVAQGPLWPSLAMIEAAGCAAPVTPEGARPLYHRPPDAKPVKMV
jgi:tRNA threonylcarbamoyladenosine biosynthesis protein TsaB